MAESPAPLSLLVKMSSSDDLLVLATMEELVESRPVATLRPQLPMRQSRVRGIDRRSHCSGWLKNSLGGKSHRLKKSSSKNSHSGGNPN